MKNKFSRYLAIYMVILMLFTGYVALDTFFITRVYGTADGLTGSGSTQTEESQESQADASQEPRTDTGSSQDDGQNSPESNSDENQGNSSGRKMPGPGQDQSSERSHKGAGPKGGPGAGSGMHGQGGRKKSGSSTSGSTSDSAGKSQSGSTSGSAGKSQSGSTSGSSSASQISSGSSSSASQAGSNTASSTGTTVDSYKDNNISIELKEYRINDTTIHVADVTVSSPEYLKTALAQNSYGKNVTQKTSEMAENVGAVLAVNGDYYGAQEKGYVIRNGVLYRDTAVSGREDLVIYADGSFAIINESEVSAEQLIANGAKQTLAFGPALVIDGSISVGTNEEVGRATASNPRTAIGILDENHYVFVVSDGRTDGNAGLSLYELADFMQSLGAKTAYNLDGGGSSTMYFKGSIVNTPSGGMGSSERSVSDIVYIG